MDSQTTTQQDTTITPNQEEEKFAFLKNKKILLIAGISALLLFIGVLIVLLITKGNVSDKNNTTSAREEEYEKQRQEVLETGQADAIILYGSATNSGTDIYAFDLQNAEEYILANLPANIKQITAISDSQLLYLEETNDLDFAKKLNIYNLDTKESSTIYEATDDYYIDGYIVSEDISYVIAWEIKTGSTGALQGGNSRLQSINLTEPYVTTVIIDQSISGNNSIHYPVLATADNNIYLDSFLPNSGAGWAYGMSIADLSTNSIQPISSVQNGSYSSRPSASPDGSLILFAGYDETRGSGTEEVGGFRRALVLANTIELLDTTNNQRSKLENLSEDNTYIRLKWGFDDNIIYTALNGEGDIGEYLYNTSLTTSTLIDESPDTFVISQLSDNIVLQGTVSDSTTDFRSNLSSQTLYQYTYTSLGVKNMSNQKDTKIPAVAPFIQYIDTIYTSPSSASNVMGVSTLDRSDIIDRGEKINASKYSLQLQEFPIPTEPVERETISEVEPEIPTSEPQPTQEETPQEDPDEPVGVKPAPKDDNDDPEPTSSYEKPISCHDIVDPICESKHPVEDSYNDPDWPDFQDCRRSMSKEYQADGKCDYTPLYLYGSNGMEVDVNFHTPIFNTNINNDSGSYKVVLRENNKLEFEQTKYESISADFQPTRKINPPLYGTIVKKRDVDRAVKEYANKLGLNKKETEDLVTDIKSKTTKDYIFFSFYTQDQSKYILPISFDPQPDTYINYVFYLRNLDSPYDLGYTPRQPQFEKTERKGNFVAVEISVDAN